jgi:hypothetical protein
MYNNMHRWGDNNANRMDRLLFHFRSHETTIPDIKLEDIISNHGDDIDIDDAKALVSILNKTGPNIRFYPFFRHSNNDSGPSPSGIDRLERVSFQLCNNNSTKTKTEDDNNENNNNDDNKTNNKIISLTIGAKNTSSVVVPLALRRLDMLETLRIFDYKSIERQPLSQETAITTQEITQPQSDVNGNDTVTLINNRTTTIYDLENESSSASASASSQQQSPQFLQFENVKRLFITRVDAVRQTAPINLLPSTTDDDATSSSTEEPHMLEMFPNLEVLSFRQCSREIDTILNDDLSETRCSEFHHPTNYLNSLLRLELDYCNMKNSMYSLIHCAFRQNLTHIGLSHCHLTEVHLEIFMFDVLHYFPNLVTADFEGNNVRTLRYIGKRIRNQIKDNKNKTEEVVEYSTKFRRLILKHNPFAVRAMLLPSSRTFLPLLRVYKGLSDFGLTDLSPEVDKLRRTNHVEKVFRKIPIGYMPIVLQESSTKDKSDVYAFLRYSPLLQLLLLRNDTKEQAGGGRHNNTNKRHKTTTESTNETEPWVLVKK